MFEDDQLTRERDRLEKQDSLTVIDYIRSSIEILLHMNQADAEGSKEGNRHQFKNLDDAAPSDFSSTFQSIDFPPKEYEAQLQAYEAEVRNHIKVEQQLKLHIEVL